MIYFDNAATTFPKPREVLEKTCRALGSMSFNSGRGGYAASIAAAEKIFSVREKIGNMFSFSPERVVFTKNCTEALNYAIKGSAKKGCHIIISSLEHNSVSRVVQKLKDDGVVDYDIAEYSPDSEKTVKNFENLIRPETSVIICMHSSNVFGVRLPTAEIGKLCRQKGIRFIVDAAQGAGADDIDAKRDNIDILCAPGHKCLFGAMGTGFLAVGDDIELESIEEGGTGSRSMSLSQPDFFPDKLESGTLNNSGIVSVGAGIDFINRIGRENILRRESMIADYIYSSLRRLSRVILYTDRPSGGDMMPIVSFNLQDISSERTAELLAQKDICVRAGYHCSPLAHKTFSTADGGTVRVSPGYFNTEQDCNKFVNVVKNL